MRGNRAGEYRLPVDYYTRANPPGAVDSFGEPNDAGTLVKQIFAKIEPVSGDETFIASAENPTATHKISFRYDPDLPLKSGDYLVYGSRTFEIFPPQNIESRNRRIELVAKENGV